MREIKKHLKDFINNHANVLNAMGGSDPCCDRARTILNELAAFTNSLPLGNMEPFQVNRICDAIKCLLGEKEDE